MQLETTFFQRNSGWSSDLPTGLDSDSTFLVCFGGAAFCENPSALLELRRAFPRSRILGCSTAGEIYKDSVQDDSIVVAVGRMEQGAVRTASTTIGPGTQSFRAGEEIARRLAAPDLRAIFLLSEGLHVNGSELVRGVSSATPESVSVTGGLAADGERFQRTWVFDGDVVGAERVAALGIYGERAQITHGSKGGWDIFGPERRITKAVGNVLHELDGKPALKLYKEYLGDRAAGIPATALLFPLAVRGREDDEKQLVRTILAVNEEEQSITFAGDMPVGSLAQLMRANFDRLVMGASGAATMASGVWTEGAPILSLAISCVGRRLVLGERTEEEIEAVRDVLPSEAKQVGFYSYGEISPFTTGACDLHNQTMTLTTVSER